MLITSEQKLVIKIVFVINKKIKTKEGGIVNARVKRRNEKGITKTRGN